MKLTYTKLFVAMLSGFIMFSCAKQPETIIVNENPQAAQTARQDTTPGPSASADFKQLIIGELHPITTLDPLFADNNSARRAIQLLHEGLVQYNEDGEVVPGISIRWTVSGDSLQYVFTLRGSAFYHDSPVFSSGIGRKVLARDVKFDFDRMAQNNVPDEAASLFMSIEGFEPYFNEQHKILNPAYRELDGVNGITVSNDSTVVFNLVEKDSHFLEKLATPVAVIYPREAVTDNPQNFAKVGAGPFKFSQNSGDSLYVFAKNMEYWQGNAVPVLNRVDIKIEQNEQNLLNSVEQEEIDLIPELGPQMLGTILDSNATLKAEYANDYSVTVPGGSTTYDILYNPEARISENTIHSLFGGLDVPRLIEPVPSSLIKVKNSTDSLSTAPDLSSSIIYSTSTEDPFQQWLLQQISNQWMQRPQLQMADIRTPSRQTAIYTRSIVPLYPGDVDEPLNEHLVQYTVNQTALVHSDISGLYFNTYPWWIDLRNVDVSDTD